MQVREKKDQGNTDWPEILKESVTLKLKDIYSCYFQKWTILMNENLVVCVFIKAKERY